MRHGYSVHLSSLRIPQDWSVLQNLGKEGVLLLNWYFIYPQFDLCHSFISFLQMHYPDFFPPGI